MYVCVYALFHMLCAVYKINHARLYYKQTNDQTIFICSLRKWQTLKSTKVPISLKHNVPVLMQSPISHAFTTHNTMKGLDVYI